MPGQDDVDVAALAALASDPSAAKSLIGFNVTHWLTRRPRSAFGAVARLLGWIADGTITGPRITTLPLTEAANALTLLERGENIGKIILIP